MFLLFAFLATAFGANIDLPTPYPTHTPAPASDCQYVGTDPGPFALDCLQQYFIQTAGCSVRGSAYPTETKLDTNDKKYYNGVTWDEAKAQMDAIKVDADGGTVEQCLGLATPQPTPDPTLPPTTARPVTPPTENPIGNSETPAPVYSEEYRLRDLYSNDGASVTTDIRDACDNKGYNRQYDATRYVVEMTSDGHNDYYTSSDPICEMLEDPANKNVQWSDRVDGPFLEVTVTGRSFGIFGSVEALDSQRVFPNWTSDTVGGRGSHSAQSLSAADGLPYSLKITSFRSYQPCREHNAPQAQGSTFDGSPGFSTRCERAGATAQVYSDLAEECESTDHSRLLYAIANNMWATCDTECIWSVDFDKSTYDKANGVGGKIWEWDTGTQCWKADTHAQFTLGIMKCDVTDAQTAQDVLDQHAFVEKEQLALCKARCDYVQGWFYGQGSCYHLALTAEYTASTDNLNNAKAHCDTVLDNGETAYPASIANKEENALAVEICGGSTCYFAGLQGKNTGGATFQDGTTVGYTNFQGTETAAGLVTGGDELALLSTGEWLYADADQSYNVLCESNAKLDKTESMQAKAEDCRDAAAESSATSSYPELIITESGFTDPTAPGTLQLVVDVPKTMFDTYISFENSTNDMAEYYWGWDNSNWVVTEDQAALCTTPTKYTGKIEWTDFNLGGAGGVQRLATFDDSTGTQQTTTDANDGERYYIFGSVIRVEAKQPIKTSVQTDDSDSNEAERRKRTTYYTRDVTVRVPFLLRFQKTVTVTTNVNIVSTKFNYKTVAAIIQSIQHSTQYFEPPYAKLDVQIRTKSQYPYMFSHEEDANGNLLGVTAHRGTVDEETADDNEQVNLSIDWLVDDQNCTFTNPDHMREGDICVQEWMLHITPHNNVCYATGEYSLEFTADCFDGKDVCYLPKDSNNADIKTVTFTFKIQTSKFCPEVADQVDLSGTLEVTGRHSFKPNTEGVEGATGGQIYMQGETIYLFAETSSNKATIVETEVTMVELEQELTGLVQTGYNRVPYDESTKDVTVWIKDSTIATGTINVNDGDGTDTNVGLMDSDDVYMTGNDGPIEVGNTPYSFSATEAGFKILLHARAFPVNVDSFGTKTLVATLSVKYDSLTATGRRRLLSARPTTDTRSRAKFQTRAWQPKSMPKGLGEVASMAMEMTLDSKIDRNNVRMFAHSVQNAIVTSLNDHSTRFNVYDSQVAIDAVYSGGFRIWSRPQQGHMQTRRLLAAPQNIRVEFTFANVPAPNAMPLSEMVHVFDKQLRSPASPLMHQPVFFGAVVHDVSEIKTSTYRPPSLGEVDNRMTSSAVAFVPFALITLLSIFC